MTAPVEPMTVPYDAHRMCSECGMPSPRVVMCGECEIAARGDAVIDTHLATIDALRATVAAQAKVIADLQRQALRTCTMMTDGEFAAYRARKEYNGSPASIIAELHNMVDTQITTRTTLETP